MEVFKLAPDSQLGDLASTSNIDWQVWRQIAEASPHPLAILDVTSRMPLWQNSRFAEVAAQSDICVPESSTHIALSVALDGLSPADGIRKLSTSLLLKGRGRARTAILLAELLPNNAGSHHLLVRLETPYAAAQREIRNRKQAEEALRASEERLRFTLEAAHVGTWNWDAHTDRLEWSDNLCRMHDVAPEAFGGDINSFLACIHPDDRPLVLNAQRNALSGGGNYHVEYRLNRSDRTIAWMEGKGRVVRDREGTPAGMAGICMDVTERKLAEQRFRAAVESSPSAVVMVDSRGRISLVNSQTELLFGYPREELLGRSVDLLVPDRFRSGHPVFRSQFHAHPQARPMGSGRDLFALRKDGSEFPVEIGLNPIQMADGVYVLSVILDITERKKTEGVLQQVNTELRQKNAELEQFVYTVSHDLKSPLVTASGFIGLIKEDLAEGRFEQLDEFLGRLERATVRMGDLIDDLLQLSRIGRVEHERRELDTASLLADIGEELSDRLRAARARLCIEPGMPRLFADPVRLAEIFENLLTNALKYGCPGEQNIITVGCRREEKECVLFFRDCGPGIPEEFHERVFKLFQRLDTSSDGTGVGLAIVARIMQLHGGRVWIDKQPGPGTTFCLAFPAASARWNAGDPPNER